MSKENKPDIATLQEGMNLIELKKEVVQGNINLYAEASKDFNPIHIDEEFAKTTPLGGTIAHGILILAYISQMMTCNFGQYWGNNGKLNVKFKSPARPGDVLTIGGNIKNIVTEEGQTLFKCNIYCRNQSDETIISGDSTVNC